MKKLLMLLVVLALVGAGGFWYWRANAAQAPNYRTETVKRGKLVATISATGTIEPEEVIDVGAQVAGRIEYFGADPRSQVLPDTLRAAAAVPSPASGVLTALAAVMPMKIVDYNSPVERNTVLVQLDASLYQAQVDSARANLAKARADLLQQEAKLELATNDMERAQQLAATRANAQADYDIARAAFVTAKASIELSKATIAQTTAALKTAEVNLSYTTIRSPVKGVIIDRRINVGQTVVASLNAPSLFLIAKDLKKLQVWAQVNEADIGQIKAGQLVRFNVDAHPGVPFKGVVAQDNPRLNATMTSNVVTYTVVVNTDNPDLKLKPYLTANLDFVVAERDNALLVSNTALRWRPPLQHVVPEERAWYAKLLNPKRDQKGATAAEQDRSDRGLVWVRDGDLVRPVRVKIGLTDGTNTEILSGPLTAETEVVVREDRQDTGGPGGGGSPFTPNMFKKKE